MEIRIGGLEHPIRFTMSAWEEMEEECGLALSSVSELKEDAGFHARARLAIRLLAPLLHAGGGFRSLREAVDVLGDIRPEEYGLAILGAMACIRKAMKNRIQAEEDNEDYDPVLRDLDRKAARRAGRELSWRTASAWGLIAGISLTEQRDMAPGVVMDMFLTRRDYDDQQHGIRRKGREQDDLLAFGSGKEDKGDKGERED